MSTNPNVHRNVHSEFDSTTEVKQPTLYTELEKDASDMDVGVIEREIASDYPENPDEGCAKMLRHILQPLQKETPHTHRRATRLAQAAAVLLCVVCLSVATVGVARGIGGDSVLQFFSSLLGLSSFSSNMVEEHHIARESAAPSVSDGLWAREDENVFVTYSTQDELLAAFPYYPEGFNHLLEAYTFVTAYRNTDSVMTSWVLTVSAADTTPIYINLVTPNNDEAVFFSYEENVTNQDTIWIRDIQLSCVNNYESASVTWADTRVHCCIWGYQPLETLVAMADQLITA